MEEMGRPSSFFVVIAYCIEPGKLEEHDAAYVAIYDYYRKHCPEIRSARIYDQHYGSLIPGGRSGTLEILEFESLAARAAYLENIRRDHPELPGLLAAWRRTTVPGSIQIHGFADHGRHAWVGPN